MPALRLKHIKYRAASNFKTKSSHGFPLYQWFFFAHYAKVEDSLSRSPLFVIHLNSWISLIWSNTIKTIFVVKYYLYSCSSSSSVFVKFVGIFLKFSYYWLIKTQTIWWPCLLFLMNTAYIRSMYLLCFGIMLTDLAKGGKSIFFFDNL